MGKENRPSPEPPAPDSYDPDDLLSLESMQYPTEIPDEEEEAPAADHATQAPTLATNVDRGALTQLLSAAQQCGLSVNADAIIEVRDRDLRAGRFQKAFDTIERVYVQVNAQISRRADDLRRQEMQYRSGALRMSPKEWLTLQQREQAQTQRIDRARRHFTRVLDGLNLLRTSSPN